MFSIWEIILQQLVNGLTLGSFYALVALGYTMVYGIVKLLNFAHGDIFMTGAFVCLSVFHVISQYIPGWPGIAIAITAAMIVSGIVGYSAQRFAYRPLLDAPRLSLLITAIGVSLVINNFFMVITKGRSEPFKSGLDDFAGLTFGNVKVTYIQIIVLVVSAILMISLTLFIKKTMWGKAMRAVSLDKDACKLMGIDVKKVISVTFIIGSALAAIGGGMYCIRYGNVSYNIGYLFGIKAFTAAVIGGIGSVPGAMLGGIMLGVLEAVGTQIDFIGSQWKDAFTFALLILILVFRPNGIFGKSEIERM